MTVRIRDGSEADIEGIARVHVQGWRESYKDFLSPDALAGLSVEERMMMWQRVLDRADPQSKLLVAETRDGEIVGFARGGPIRSKEPVLLGTEAEIFAIYLLDRVKRQGIGRRLMNGVFDHLRSQGFRSVGLWVLKENLPARRFYEALGGTPGPEQAFDLRGQTVTEIAYRFDPEAIAPLSSPASAAREGDP
ncbi:GNAT family N-acetyltransferase [Microvirga aerilata]|uniref:GNAT family N-acetyltransferase n=1 Tax=Microvirga aerilata TaxID=670292 RepID=A0A937D0Z2_9HYPH|nr:GNAT family N-acetyltransferase [Microvirga aerilata]MBL0406411.1 GNAT family N-acetyltransferase [Microvirga aerilata]